MVHPDNISSKPDFRVIIAGGRDFNDYALLKAKCDNILAEKTATHRIVIVSGAARGADSLGERYAREHGYTLDSHPADWNTHGKSAGYVRNAQMANSADALIAFWDGHSRGTKHMIDTSIRNGLSVRTILYANQITKNNMEVHLQRKWANKPAEAEYQRLTYDLHDDDFSAHSLSVFKNILEAFASRSNGEFEFTII